MVITVDKDDVDGEEEKAKEKQKEEACRAAVRRRLASAVGKFALPLEEALFVHHKGKVGTEYRQHFHLLIPHLRKEDNGHLRRLAPAQLVALTPLELASPSVRAHVEAQERAAMDDRVLTPQEATCTEYVCRKCGRNKTTYYQLQTRGADEPMTTFVTCTHCAHRWQF